METFISRSEDQTILHAHGFASGVRPPAVICLRGDLGSGKTVFARGLAIAFGIDGRMIKSPTYTLVRHYPAGKLDFYHFDFYRIEEADDLIRKDLEDVFSRNNAIVAIEWPERITDILPQKRIFVDFEYLDECTRRITVRDDRKRTKKSA